MKVDYVKLKVYPINPKATAKKNSELANKLTNELNRILKNTWLTPKQAEKGKITTKINSKMLDLNLCQ